MNNMLRKLREARAEADSAENGFTLIELLVVVVIIGILVAIAIPIYLNYEHGAQSKSAQSDARNAAATIEQCKADADGSLPATFTSSAGTDETLSCGTPAVTETVVVSKNNTMVYTKDDPSAGFYTIKVTNSDSGKSFTYYSSTGKFSS